VQVLEDLAPVEREVSNNKGEWFLARLLPYRTTDDRIDGVVLTLVDITQRKRAEEALRQNKERLDTAMDAARIFSWDMSTHKKQVEWSANTERVLGFALPSDFEALMAVVHPEDRETLAREVETALASGTHLEADYRLVHPQTSETMWLRTQGTPTSDESGDRMTGTTQNITARKQAEIELTQSREHLQSAMQAGRIFWWEMNPATRHSIYSSNMEEIIGFALHENIDNVVNLIHPDDAAPTREAIEQVLMRGGNYESEYRLVNPANGEAFWFHSRGAMQTALDGKPRFVGITQNITAQKRAQAAQMNFRQLFESAPGNYLVLDPDYTIVAASDSYLQTSMTQREAIMNRNLFEVFPVKGEHGGKDNLRASFDRVKALKRADAMAVQYYPIPTPDGGMEERWWSPVNSPILGENGELAYIIHRVEDVSPYIQQMKSEGREVEAFNQLEDRTRLIEADIVARGQELQRANEQLRENELRLKKALSIETVGVIYLDMEGRFTGANDAFLRMSGWSCEALTSQNKSWRDLTPPEWMERSEQAIAEIEELGRTTPYEKEYLRADGSRFWGLFAATRINDHEIVEYVLDISERRQTENDLRESEERFRLLVEGARDYALFLMDSQRRIIHWNSGAERIFNYSASEAVGKSGDMIFTPEDCEKGAPEEEMQTALREGRAPDKRWHRRHDDSLFWADGVLRTLYDKWGEPRGFVKVLRNATEERCAQDALREAHAELEARVLQRTEELAQSNEQLRSEMRERARVEQAREQLLQRLVTTQEEERRRISRELHDQLGQQMTALLMGLDALPDVDTGLRPPSFNKQVTTLQGIADNLMKQMHHLAWELRPATLDNLGLEPALRQQVQDWSRQSGIPADFVARGLQPGLRMHADVETALYRVVQEALTNVQRHAHANRVGVMLERSGNFVLAIIEDDGRGFEFEQNPDGTPHPVAQRLGVLGMQERMELVKGTLTIESTPDSGTTIYARGPIGRHSETREETDGSAA
jgi:PAS domain S-box-containing protein